MDDNGRYVSRREFEQLQRDLDYRLGRMQKDIDSLNSKLWALILTNISLLAVVIASLVMK